MNAHVQSAVYTLLILFLGVLIGIWIDTYRLGLVREGVSLIDISSDDARLLSSIIERFGSSQCDSALQQNLAFNERIFNGGREIEKKLNANIFTPEIEQQWRKYTLLQTQFWMNSITLKEKCGFDYHTVVHLFKLQDRMENSVDDSVMSSVLLELKEICGNKIMLVPITADMSLVSVDAVVSKNGITKFPAVVIDEDTVFQGVTSLPKLREAVGC